MNYIDALNWRYAVKQFSNEKLSSEQIEQIKQVVSLSASAYGMQPYKLLIIEDQSLKRDCVPHSYGQDKVEHCSHLLVFANQTSITEQDIDDYIKGLANTQGIEEQVLEPYKKTISDDLLARTQREQAEWCEQQCYIALGNLLSFCAVNKIDAGPMTGFDAAGINQVLGLNEQGLNAAIFCPVGYRSEADLTSQRKKYRKPISQLVTRL